MTKEGKRGFFSWLGFYRQNNEVVSELEAGRDTDTNGETDAPVVTTAAQGEAVDAAKEALAKAQTPTAERTLESDVSTCERNKQPITTKIVSITEHVEIRRSHANVSDKTPMAAVAAENNAVSSPSSDNGITPLSKNIDVVDTSIVIADVAAPGNSVLLAPARTELFNRLKSSLAKTRYSLGSGFIGLFRDKKIDNDLFDKLEEQLLISDVGVETTRKIIEGLTAHAKRRYLKDAEALYSQLRVNMTTILANVERPLEVTDKAPFVILMVGVNGVGKTTTIGKLARQYKTKGKSVMLAAGDTFRAAAVEQLQIWGESNRIPVVAQQPGADSASVIFDAIQAAKARGIDVLIADTAGRLQNKAHLMNELKKIVRVIKKLDVEAPHEVMLTLDASTGLNVVSQASLFNDAVGITGITLTKLDGTAKGGIIFAVADHFDIPIRYISVGAGIEDLRPFKADDFIEVLFTQEDQRDDSL